VSVLWLMVGTFFKFRFGGIIEKSACGCCMRRTGGVLLVEIFHREGWKVTGSLRANLIRLLDLDGGTTPCCGLVRRVAVCRSVLGDGAVEHPIPRCVFHRRPEG